MYLMRMKDGFKEVGGCSFAISFTYLLLFAAHYIRSFYKSIIPCDTELISIIPQSSSYQTVTVARLKSPVHPLGTPRRTLNCSHISAPAALEHAHYTICLLHRIPLRSLRLHQCTHITPHHPRYHVSTPKPGTGRYGPASLWH